MTSQSVPPPHKVSAENSTPSTDICKNSESAREKQYWNVAVNTPLRNLFTYLSPEDVHLKSGQSVKVPFGPKNKEVSGLVVERTSLNPKEEFEIKRILEKDEEKPPLGEKNLKWLKWISEYYIYPLGQIQQLIYPPLKKHSRRKSRKTPVVPEVIPVDPLPLTSQQKQALAAIKPENFGVYLLHGVTGSGKTEVYMEMIGKVLAHKKAALVLVPEISLTPQLIRRFSERFQREIAVIHSHLTEREKTDQWWQVVDGKKRLLIGARSALFCPIPNIGLIVVDEEHETSFKQDEKLKYNARDVAVMKANLENCPIILGSATPSLESWQNALSGKYHLISMNKRVLNRPMPQVEIINPQKDRDPSLPYWLSGTLHKKLKRNYENKLQSALFLNRRGMAPSVQCYACGFVYHCPNCDISLTLHGRHHLLCHYCNYCHRLDKDCPDCKESELKAYGLGTEAVEENLKELFPEASIFRADRDEITNREALETMIHKMENHDIDFLVGTQMIAKGLDFEKLTLVGIIHADVSLNIPDFRASERSFQLCTQVSGRAGRHQTAGEVVIQTYKVKHPSLVSAKSQNYQEFAKKELEHRKLFGYPPFGKLAVIRITGLHKEKLVREARLLANHLRELIQKFSDLGDSQILGPGSAPLARIKNRYRHQILIKGKDYKVIHHIANQADRFIHDHIRSSKCIIDIDPYNLL